MEKLKRTIKKSTAFLLILALVMSITVVLAPVEDAQAVSQLEWGKGFHPHVIPPGATYALIQFTLTVPGRVTIASRVPAESNASDVTTFLDHQGVEINALSDTTADGVRTRVVYLEAGTYRIRVSRISGASTVDLAVIWLYSSFGWGLTPPPPPPDPPPQPPPPPPPPPTGNVGWVQSGGNWFFYRDNARVTGWLNDGGVWYYLQSGGAMATGWVDDGGVWYFMHANGAMATGWVSDGGVWYFMHASGAMATGWINDGGTWFFLRPNGAMATGWLQDGGTWYYLHANGAMATGWVLIDGTWHYFLSSGAWWGAY